MVRPQRGAEPVSGSWEWCDPGTVLATKWLSFGSRVFDVFSRSGLARVISAQLAPLDFMDGSDVSFCAEMLSSCWQASWA